MLERTKLVFENIENLLSKKVAVIGLGGVGSYAATALARSGLGNLILVDGDKIEQSNINRQEFAFISTVGQYKTDVAYKIIKDINSKINLELVPERIKDFNDDVDFIIDAIDDIDAKINLAKHDNVISCMGTAKRVHPELLKYDDIYNTSICPMCKKVRKACRSANIKELPVVYSTELPVKANIISEDNKYNGKSSLGSTSFVPPVAGFMLASYVVRKLLGEC